MFHLILVMIYLAFISLGLPDGLLGAAWPAMQPQLQVPVSWMGTVSLIISGGTVVSSLLSDRLTRRFGTGRLTAFSVAMTAGALFGFASSRAYWMLILWAIPYGLGAGSVDSCLNNYVALHYSGKHMSWLHCMWGIGAAAGPVIMGAVLSGGAPWNHGYLYIGIAQAILTAALLFCLPAWRRTEVQYQAVSSHEPLGLREIFALPGAKAVMLTFFCYCALEQTAGQWAASYFYAHLGQSEERSAALAGLYYMGLTAGRGINGFLTVRFSDKALVRAGIVLIGVGLLVMLFPLGVVGAVTGLLLMGFGSAPIYPCIIHATPNYFGAENSQAVIGVEMAFAYVGICVMPPVYGIIAQAAGLWTLPVVLGVILFVMHFCHESLFCSIKPKS